MHMAECPIRTANADPEAPIVNRRTDARKIGLLAQLQPKKRRPDQARGFVCRQNERHWLMHEFGTPLDKLEHQRNSESVVSRERRMF
jgi:hypothetical protein